MLTACTFLGKDFNPTHKNLLWGMGIINQVRLVELQYFYLKMALLFSTSNSIHQDEGS